LSTIAFDELEVLLAKLDKVLPYYKSKTVDAVMRNDLGEVIFELKGVEAPEHWSQLAINIAAEKYFKKGTNPETSVFQMTHRVAEAISQTAVNNGYITNRPLFMSVLDRLLLGQYFSFNSPVWFNVGNSNDEPPRISACYLLGIEDSMESILDTVKTEGMIYKNGSGSGINYSNLRGKGEKLSKGGVSSGPLSFLKAHDAITGSIKSGGTTRRAAKLVGLNVDHPDIEAFINCKSIEEKKAKALIEAGYSNDFRNEDGAYGSIAFQNANHSVRVTDLFMQAVKQDNTWALVPRTKDPEFYKFVSAKKLFREIAEAAWNAGDPGLQFHDTINNWNVHNEIINTSNPCSEIHLPDFSACNLASINLIKFIGDPVEGYDFEFFRDVAYFVTVCLDILLCDCEHPHPLIHANSDRYRQIGLGFANLGTVLMVSGYPYDSDRGRKFAAAIAGTMLVASLRASVDMAQSLGHYPSYDASVAIPVLTRYLFRMKDAGVSLEDIDYVDNHLHLCGLRNSFLTAIAPTGTIGFQMDCSTFGVEPEIALVKYKKLVGGGFEKIVNSSVPLALERMGYSEKLRDKVVGWITENGTAEGAVGEEELALFDTSIKPENSNRVIPWQAHIKMVAAIQPFITGGISKTVNMPKDATVEDVEQAFMMAWEMGLKCITIYRDGCKSSQPYSTTKDTLKTQEKIVDTPVPQLGRRKLPNDRKSITHKFDIAGHEGYITVGMYEDGTPGEVFLMVSKEGSFISGVLDSFATMISIALQHGAPVSLIINKLRDQSFEPQGYTSNPEIKFAKSLSDYLARFLDQKFGEAEKKPTQVFNTVEVSTPKQWPSVKIYNGNTCAKCGGLLVQTGTCAACSACGETTGCS